MDIQQPSQEEFGDKLKKRLENPYVWQIIPELMPKKEMPLTEDSDTETSIEQEGETTIEGVIKKQYATKRNAFIAQLPHVYYINLYDIGVSLLKFFYSDLKDIHLPHSLCQLIASRCNQLNSKRVDIYDGDIACDITLERMFHLAKGKAYEHLISSLEYKIYLMILEATFPILNNSSCYHPSHAIEIIDAAILGKQNENTSIIISGNNQVLRTFENEPAVLLPNISDMRELSQFVGRIAINRKKIAEKAQLPSSIHDILYKFVQPQIESTMVKKSFSSKFFSRLGIGKTQAEEAIPASAESLYEALMSIQQMYTVGMHSVKLGMDGLPKLLEEGIVYVEMAKMFAEEISINLPKIQTQMKLGNVNLDKFGLLVADMKLISSGDSTNLVDEVSRSFHLAQKTIRELER